ncbi:MAG: 50S ribosomal protein L23 [Candidatus Roizmanbacteria bacterium GW2011_GWC2_37_13]|uniref:Large ribosomal subunit protein uL23 n=1 Tax=Candidatus Roizmanbacteria bacterium GW2011_GWC2_37_13 TaxID=1618486 RepID=A0A0G0JEP9_9BACT|nr:MAG: seg [Candidatus Roizmanbacteria bacterium GW2011_GWC1_37_12]KKQ26641.1 MAG: 50S ribosomal protein L23 [Candidatus Roizmanbacteria bacterium GW2011_GWC2_37_13]
MKINNIIVAPVLTEKATNLVKKQVYMFEVNLKANKFQIKEVIEKIYKVKVDDVRVMLRKGKSKRAGRRMTTMKLSDKKIAFVKLKEGKIDLFPQT